MRPLRQSPGEGTKVPEAASDNKIAVDEYGWGVDVSRTGSPLVVRVAGELDVATSPRLLGLLSDLIDDGTSMFDIDLSELAFIDSTGLGVLVRTQQRLRAQGGELRLANPKPSVAKVLEITGLANALALASGER